METAYRKVKKGNQTHRNYKRRPSRRRRWLSGALALLTAALAVSAGLLAWRLNAAEAELEQLRQEEDRLQAQALQAEQARADAQAQADQLKQDNASLQASLTEAQQAAQVALQALAEKLAADAEERRSTNSPYSWLYPALYAAPADVESQAPDHTVYLTFDDGPSARTAEILDILKENNIKATFFVTGQTSELAQDMMRRIVAEGHTIAIHTYTHQYKTIYASVSAYLEDFDQIYHWVHQVTGVYPQIFRFPGGTVNTYNRELYPSLVAEMDRRGFVHFDWNSTTGDADGQTHTAQELAQNALAQVGANRVIVLMHDSVHKTGTVECLPAVIAGYRDAGYAFAPLTPEVKAITFD